MRWMTCRALATFACPSQPAGLVCPALPALRLPARLTHAVVRRAHSATRRIVPCGHLGALASDGVELSPDCLLVVCRHCCWLVVGAGCCRHRVDAGEDCRTASHVVQATGRVLQNVAAVEVQGEPDGRLPQCLPQRQCLLSNYELALSLGHRDNTTSPRASSHEEAVVSRQSPVS